MPNARGAVFANTRELLIIGYNLATRRVWRSDH
jgi:hypothetical protein